jgi:hypothetical protein
MHSVLGEITADLLRQASGSSARANEGLTEVDPAKTKSKPPIATCDR